jgi:hypothetical protein
MFQKQEIEDLAALLPKRRWVTPEEREGAELLLAQAFRKQRDLARGVLKLGLHPDDVLRIRDVYQSAKAIQLGVNDIEKAVQEAKALCTEDSDWELGDFEIPAPSRAMDATGTLKDWIELLPEERAEAAAQHTNVVIATVFATRERVADAIKLKSGCSRRAALEMAGKIMGGEMHVADIPSASAPGTTGGDQRRPAKSSNPRGRISPMLWVVVVAIVVIGGWWIITSFAAHR